VWPTGVVACLCAALRVQLSVTVKALTPLVRIVVDLL